MTQDVSVLGMGPIWVSCLFFQLRSTLMSQWGDEGFYVHMSLLDEWAEAVAFRFTERLHESLSL